MHNACVEYFCDIIRENNKVQTEVGVWDLKLKIIFYGHCISLALAECCDFCDVFFFSLASAFVVWIYHFGCITRHVHAHLSTFLNFIRKSQSQVNCKQNNRTWMHKQRGSKQAEFDGKYECQKKRRRKIMHCRIWMFYWVRIFLLPNE